MKPALAAVLGVVAGVVVAGMLIQSSDCCARVADGVRGKVADKLGPTAAAVGDVLGVWKYTPGLLNFLGVS